MHSRWDSVAAKVYYSLGATYYFYKWLVTFGAIGSTIGLFGLYDPDAINLPYSIVILLFSIFPLFIGIRIWISSIQNRYQGLNPGIRIQNLYSTYFILGNDKYRVSRRIIAKTISDGIDSHSHSFSWTGQGKISAQVKNEGYKIEIIDSPHGSQKICKLHFDRPKRKGETIDLEFQIDLEDSANNARPFFSFSAKQLIEKQILLRVVLPSKDTVRNYGKKIFQSQSAAIPVSEEVGELQPGEGEISWAIKRPRLHYKYAIIW